jgi:Dr1-associated corepressor
MSGTSKGKGKNRQTRFPVARIKRIMQKDEEVGKVAQATPVVICELGLGLDQVSNSNM